jgi:hypothetical protein
MAVYQGARRRPLLGLPRVARPATELGSGSRRAGASPASAAVIAGSRRRARADAAVSRPASPRVGLVLATIVIVFSGAFLWLTQSVRVAATNYDIVRLVSERDRLENLAVDLRSDLERLSAAPAIRQEALALGYGQLGAPIVVQAR